MKILNVIGTRPQIIKFMIVRDALEKVGHDVITIDTGQHYDYEMSYLHLISFNATPPEINLDIRYNMHGEQTGNMMMALEKYFNDISPDYIFVFGDTNSTVAAALTAVKMNIPVVHIEAGVRGGERFMAEEINRVVTDSISDLLFCPTELAVSNLIKEGYEKSKIFFTGDVLYDLFLHIKSKVNINDIKNYYNINENDFFILTMHRAENVNEKNIDLLIDIVQSLNKKTLFFMHPRTKKLAQQTEQYDIMKNIENLEIFEPIGYGDMMGLLLLCDSVLTDSGGLQREAYFAGKKSVILRDRTEWKELAETRWAVPAGFNKEKVLKELENKNMENKKDIFGSGNAAEKIAEIITEKRGG